MLLATAELSTGLSCLLPLRHPYTAGGNPCLLWFLMHNFTQRLKIPVGCPFTAVLLRPAVQPQATISHRATKWWQDKRKVHYEAGKQSGLRQSYNTISVSYINYRVALSTIKLSKRHWHEVTQWTLDLCYLFKIIWHIKNLLLPINL